MDLQLLDSIIECSVCLERLKHDARVLPCQHTFCLDCLRVNINRKCRKSESLTFFSSFFSFFVQRVANKNPQSPIACPECRQQTNTFDINSLPKNVFLIRLLDQIKQTSNGSLDGHDEISTPIATTTTTTKTKTKASSEAEKKQSPPSKSQGELQSIPYAKALFDFQMNPLEDEGCLKFQKGMILQVTRRVDQNWAEGKLGEAVGIFPLSFVNMNQAATALMQSYATKWRLPASMPSTSSNDQSPSTSTSPQRQPPPMLQPTPAHPTIIRPTSPPSAPAPQVVAQLSNDKTGSYIALHNYTPLKADELELKKGSQYHVKEACQDGWLKGCCSDNPFKKGVFPGNYVMPLLYHQKMMSMQRNAALQVQKSQTSSSNTQQMRSTGAYTNLGLSSIPPELPQRNLTASARTPVPSPLTQQNNKSDASNDNPPNAQTQKTEDNASSKQKRESMTDMLMKKLGYSRKSCDSSAYSMDNPVFEDASAKTQPTQYNHMRSGSCPIDLGVANLNIENLQFGSQRVKTRERVALPM